VTSTTAFNEQRVLAELEQLELAIRATREDRERVQADFNLQLRKFEPLSVSGVPSAAFPPASARTRAPGDLEQTRILPPRSDADVSRVLAGERPDRVEPATVEVLPPRRSAWRLVARVSATVVALSLALVWVINRTPGAAPQPVVQPDRRSLGVGGQQPAPPPVVPAPQAPPTSKAAPAVDPHPLRIDLTTVRPVWLRVAVDGRIAIEREVAAGEQLPFGADRSIVVRAGDAGAVTVRVGGLDQGPIGRDGQVLTRAFAAPVR
jgi:hypothetical protein